MIPLVVGWNGHDGPGAVTGEDIIGDPDWDPFMIHRIHGVGTGKDTALFLREISALQIALGRAGFLVAGNSLQLSGIGDGLHKRMFGSQNQVSGTEECVRPCGEDSDRGIYPLDLKSNLRPFAAANPVTLEEFDRLRPFEAIEIGDQPFCIGGDT